MKKKAIRILSVISVVFLTSCVNGKSSISDTSAESSSESAPSEGLFISFSFSNPSLGKSFLESFSPTVYLAGKIIDFESLTSVSLKLGKESFSIYDPLTKEGIYKFVAKKGNYSFEKELELAKGNPVKAEDGNGYTKVSEEDATTYALQNVPYAGSLNYGKMPSIGEVNLVVIPLTFSNGATFDETELQAIEKGYFGEKEDTGWESLASYYEKSSYGKLHISGEVSDVYVSKYTEAEIQSMYSLDNDTTGEIVEEAVDYVFDKYNWDRSDFDYDNDGFLDGIEIIYKSTRNYFIGPGAGSSIWWNFTGYINDTQADKETPVPRRYFWSGIDQLTNGYYEKDIDTHTLVHETGHMLGLNDYYDYDTNSYPTGGVDMMELNVGDHCAYSKYLLGWVRPMVVDGTLDDFEVTLGSFSETGDCLLLRNTTEDIWNGTPYDEYLMLSYYTPTGLNEADSKGYKEWVSAGGYGTGGSYSYSGLQIYHVDERLYSNVGSTYDSVKGSFTNQVSQYTDNVLGTFQTDSQHVLTSDFAYQATSNTDKYSRYVSKNILRQGSSNKEIALIPATGDASLFETTSRSKTCTNMGTNKALMGLSEFGCLDNGFSMSKMKSCFNENGLFNDGSKLEYNFFVSSQTENEITVRFVKI